MAVLERIAKLETNQEHTNKKIEDIGSKVDDMHNLLMQAKGARWAIVAVAGGVGMIASIAAKFLPFLPGK